MFDDIFTKKIENGIFGDNEHENSYCSLKQQITMSESYMKCQTEEYQNMDYALHSTKFIKKHQKRNTLTLKVVKKFSQENSNHKKKQDESKFFDLVQDCEKLNLCEPILCEEEEGDDELVKQVSVGFVKFHL